MLKVPDVLSSSSPACEPGGAAVDDVDVVDRAAAGVADGPGDAAASALRIDVEATDLVAVVEVDHVGVDAVSVGWKPGFAGCSVSTPTTRPSCSPISRSPAFIA